MLFLLYCELKTRLEVAFRRTSTAAADAKKTALQFDSVDKYASLSPCCLCQQRFVVAIFRETNDKLLEQETHLYQMSEGIGRLKSLGGAMGSELGWFGAVHDKKCSFTFCSQIVKTHC